MESAWTPPPWGGGTIDPEKRSQSPRVATINLVVMCQRVYAQIEGNPEIVEWWGTAPLM